MHVCNEDIDDRIEIDDFKKWIPIRGISTFKTRDRFHKIMSSSLVGRVLLGLSLQALCGGPYEEPCAIVCHCQ